MKFLSFIALVAVFSLSIGARAQKKDLFEAARTNDVAQAQSLLEAQADVNAQDPKGFTALIIATYGDHFEVAQLLLKHGADTEKRDIEGRTALMGAAFKGNEREVKLLLDNGAAPNAKDAKGLTSTMYAAMFGRIAIIKMLYAESSLASAVSSVSKH